MYTLATLYALRQHLGFADSDTSEDARLLAALEAASTTIERRARRQFMPRQAAIKHSINRHNVRELLLTDDLLELASLTNGDGSSLDLSVITLLGSAALRLNNGESFVYLDATEDAVEVAGIWGYHRDWDQAWQDSGDTVQDNPLSAIATTLTVTDADALSASGIVRFQVGQMLRIEAEYLRVLSINTTTNTLIVERGVQGTMAASHAAATAIEIYQPPADVVQLCLRWAIWLYREPDAAPENLPPILLDTLDGLRRISVRG